MIEVPQNPDVLSEVLSNFPSDFQSEERHIETNPAPHEERYFLEGAKSRSSELLMTLHIARDFRKVLLIKYSYALQRP